MSRSLTQPEVNELLGSIQQGDVELRPVDISSSVLASPYDFTKPHSLSHSFASNLATLSDSFAKASSITLSGLFRSSVTLLSEGSKHLIFQEYVANAGNPSCMALLNLPPLRGQAILEIDSKVIFSLIDKLMGGGGEPLDRNRDFTEIEMKVAERIIDKLLADLAAATKRFIDITPSLARIDNNPEFVNICAGTERVVVIQMSVNISNFEGKLRFCIPVQAFETVIEKFDPVDEPPVRTLVEQKRDMKAIRDILKKVKLGMRAHIGSAEVPLSKLNGMSEGDLIVLDRKISEPVSLYLEGIPKYRGIPGTINGKKAVKLISVIEGGTSDDE